MKRQIALILTLILAISLCACSSSKTAEPAASEATTQSLAPAEAEVTQADIEENIIGKWIVADKAGQPALTNDKTVYNFVSTDKVYRSASLTKSDERPESWVPSEEYDVDISGNKVTLTGSGSLNKNQTVFIEFTIHSINADEFTADQNFTVTVDGDDVVSRVLPFRFVKVNDDYSKEDIVGIWEGRCTSEGSVFDDGQDHRGEFKDDGTYVYYVKDGDNWVPNEDTMNEYFVAGNLLCFRWVENDKENREWWEITIDGDTMNMTTLCEGEDGKTFTATFEMTRVGN